MLGTARHSGSEAHVSLGRSRANGVAHTLLERHRETAQPGAGKDSFPTTSYRAEGGPGQGSC